MTKPKTLEPKVAKLLQRPGPIPKADKQALAGRMQELGKRPAKPAKKGNSRGR